MVWSTTRSGLQCWYFLCLHPGREYTGHWGVTGTDEEQNRRDWYRSLTGEWVTVKDVQIARTHQMWLVKGSCLLSVDQGSEEPTPLTHSDTSVVCSPSRGGDTCYRKGRKVEPVKTGCFGSYLVRLRTNSIGVRVVCGPQVDKCVEREDSRLRPARDSHSFRFGAGILWISTNLSVISFWVYESV